MGREHVCASCIYTRPGCLQGDRVRSRSLVRGALECVYPLKPKGADGASARILDLLQRVALRRSWWTGFGIRLPHGDPHPVERMATRPPVGADRTQADGHSTIGAATDFARGAARPPTTPAPARP